MAEQDKKRRVVVVTNNKIVSGVSNSYSFRDLVENPEISHGFATLKNPNPNLRKMPSRAGFEDFKLGSVLIYDRYDATLRGSNQVAIPISDVVFIYGVDDPYETNQKEAFEVKTKRGTALERHIVEAEFDLERFRLKGEMEIHKNECFEDDMMNLHFSGFKRPFVMLSKPKLVNVQRKYPVYMEEIEPRKNRTGHKFNIDEFDYVIIRVGPEIEKTIAEKEDLIQRCFKLHEGSPILFATGQKGITYASKFLK